MDEVDRRLFSTSFREMNDNFLEGVSRRVLAEKLSIRVRSLENRLQESLQMADTQRKKKHTYKSQIATLQVTKYPPFLLLKILFFIL